ncbi:pyridoxal phosphate-dependent aminotransferase [Aquimarina sp. AD1]|uniref:pyridoxal phosphate-dependent aminotransferase n=1 Tax=Aquimarina sp. (strain AD1) TaxID=1714848 RepID=UPI000E47B0BE|nr:pyridoxal phosphate-dependent aminotransferase [Aquimarina sp. AD1]AXT56291.1 pyridoxal phosphate-dependent aminotransferase [Aquimarina sp. AD1]RKN06421.1 aminotransferase class I/II-fold pyridoxal phosphate-dependent enzyme [Aquimarina sp. AD1]
MPVISSKGKAMPESPIRKLAPFAEKAVKEGKHIFHLNIGQPDIKTPIEALNAVRNHKLDVLAYSHSAGFESFRNKLAGYYAKHDITISSDDILVTTGGSEALIFTMGSITDPGDEIIVPEPFYANYYSFSTQSTVTVVPVISQIDNGFALPPIKDFEKLITPKTKAILICNPGNPTGYLYSKEEIKQLADLAIKYDLFLISDEVYREFVYDDSEHYSILQERILDDHAIVVDSVSKRYSMCGARIGCMVSKNKSVMETAMKFAQARLSPPTFAQIASEAALEAPESYYTETVAKYKIRRDTLVDGLRQIPGVKVATPNGAFYCIAELPIEDADHFTKWLLDEFHVNNETVMLAPAAGFYSSPNEGLNQVRIAYVLNRRDLKKAINILKLALAKYTDQKSFSIIKEKVSL